MTISRLDTVLAAIDRVNSEDPNQVMLDGVAHKKELLYGQQMSACLATHWPQANEQIQIAARAQHIKRWHLKRSDFATGKVGYLAWRKQLGQFHGELTASIMQQHGYSSDEAEQVSAIVRKQKLKSNADSQTLEDVACLVFLEHYFAAFAEKHDEDKIIRILQKTWHKMSEQSHQIALGLTLPAHLSRLVGKALGL
jgi:hypothetical protein